MKTVMLVVIGGLLMLGTLFLTLGLNFFKDTKSFLKTSVRVKGRVIGLESQTGPNMSERFAPKVEYVVPNEGEFVFVSGFFSSNNSYEIGQTVKVLHDAKNPGNSKLYDPMVIWLPSLGLILGGFICLVGGLFIFFKKFS